MIRVTVVRAHPGHHRTWPLTLTEGATVQEALIAAQASAPEALVRVAGYAVFGVRVQAGHVLRDGDRLELLEALQADPKDARRRRAAASRGAG